MDIQFWFEYLKLFQDIWFSGDSLWDIWNWLKISPRPELDRLARAGLLLLLLACCCCTCHSSPIHVLDLLGVYYPTANSSPCSPQAGSRRPDPIHEFPLHQQEISLGYIVWDRGKFEWSWGLFPQLACQPGSFLWGFDPWNPKASFEWAAELNNIWKFQD